MRVTWTFNVATVRRFGGIFALSILAWAVPDRMTMATDYNFTKIVDSLAVLPGTTDPFDTFTEVYYDGSNIAFIGRGDSGAEGVFQWDGTQLNTVADTSTAVPGTAGVFSDFRSLSQDAGAVAFVSEGTVVDGVYTTLGGSLRTVADTTTIMPGSSVPFSDFSFGDDVEIGDSRVAFTASGNNGSTFNQGAYVENAGVLQVVADRSDTIPGFGENFIFFSEVDVDHSGVVFSAGRGSGGGNGFFTTNGAASGTLRTVYDANTPIPGLTQPNSILSPNSIRLDDGVVAFEARGENGVGAILLDRAGNIETVVSDTTNDPVSNSDFRSFYSYTLDDGEVAFVGFGSGPTGIYKYGNGGLENVINSLDFLDGKDVSQLSLSPGGLNAGSLAFRARFTDGTSAIYLASAGPTTGPQTIELAPTFDVQLTPGDTFTLEEGASTLSIDGEFGSSFPTKDALIDFPLDQIPDNAEILGATLTLDGSSSSGSVRIVVDGYAGDGLAATADVTALTTQLAVSDPYTAGSDISIDLNVDFIETLLPSASHLGLRLSSLFSANFLSVLSSEAGFGEPPALTIDFQLPVSTGDYDLDGDVDLDDLDAYNGNIGAAATDELAALDLNDDGTVGADDFAQHYQTLVETSNGQVGTFGGDVNLDGVVDVLGDAAALIDNLGNSVSSWSQGDLNGDGTVDVLGDAALLIENLGNSNAGTATAATAAVPEPTSLSLLALASLGVIGRRRC